MRPSFAVRHSMACHRTISGITVSRNNGIYRKSFQVIGIESKSTNKEVTVTFVKCIDRPRFLLQFDHNPLTKYPGYTPTSANAFQHSFPLFATSDQANLLRMRQHHLQT